jgi:galactokinase
MVPENVSELFREAYGCDPEVIASAPGRVNLIGEHLDYNGGEVLPMAIASRTWVAMRRSPSGPSSRVVSSTEEDTGKFDSPPAKSGKWWDYISGLASLPGRSLPPADIAVMSDVPAGAGLSSSAALEVAAGLAYAALSGSSEDLRWIALDGWRVENDFVGVESGIMDQFASALSTARNALHVWCDTLETEHVPFAGSVLIFDTAVPRSLRDSDFNRRRAECTEALHLLRRSDPGLKNLAQATLDMVEEARLPENLSRRATHVVTEMGRVHAAVEQLRERGTIDAALLYESHGSLRDRYQCSSPELDWFVDRSMRVDGVNGARLTGAGWGGCAIAFGSRDALTAAGDEISFDYEREFDRKPRVWLSEASPGARIELRHVPFKAQ